MTTEAKPRPAMELDVRRFTPAEFLALVEVGILTSSDRVELLDGVIIEMAPIGDPHAGTVDVYTEMLPSGVDQGTLLRVQGPLALDERSTALSRSDAAAPEGGLLSVNDRRLPRMSSCSSK